MASSPPYYVLLSHSTLAASSTTATTHPPPTLAHPTIQYQYRDDPAPVPLASPAQHVLVMDYDPASPDSVHVQSLSPHLAVVSIKATDAPGTGVGSVGPDDPPKNTRMYVLETVAHQQLLDKNVDDIPPVVSLTNFKQRNALLRKALEYPLPSAPLHPAAPPTASSRPSPSSASAPLPPTTPTL